MTENDLPSSDEALASMRGSSRVMGSWHVDRNVPVALIFTIAVQGAIGIWWASDITRRLIAVEASENAHSTQVDALVKLQEARYERVIRLEEKLAGQTVTLDRIEKKLDELKR